MKFPYFPHLKSSGGWTCSTASSLIVILAALLCLQQPCHAQQPLAPQLDLSANPLNGISWFSGPQKITLGDFADINIPSGCRLTDVHGARTILASIGDAIPDDLVGILAPVSGKWIAILEYSPVGYVRNPDVTQINTKAVLKDVLNQIKKQEPSSVPTLSWQSQPAYDANRHLLVCSLKLETPTSKILNQTAVMFGRRGVVQVTVAQPSLNAGVPSLMQLVGNIDFKPGERYADYKRGDKVAEIGLAEIILGETHPQTAGLFSGGFGSLVPWVYCALGACLITGGGVVVFRRNKTRRRRARDPVPAPASKNSGPVRSVSSPPAALINSGFIGPAQPKPVLNRSYLAKPFRRRRRKRLFDYSKFYSKILRNISGSAYGPPISSNLKSNFYGHTNGNGNSAGPANVHSNGHGGSIGTNVGQLTTSELQELIATQKSLIQEQKCLLEHQTRLIEEKRRLIEEQIAFLKTQSSLAIDPQDYPIKVAQ